LGSQLPPISKAHCAWMLVHFPSAATAAPGAPRKYAVITRTIVAKQVCVIAVLPCRQVDSFALSEQRKKTVLPSRRGHPF
jgi:hypothetical protein